MKRLFMLFSACLLCMYFTTGQNLAINADGSLADPNAILDIKSNNKGVLIPRMDAAARLSIPNTKGMLVYDTTSNTFWYNTGTTWLSINAGITATATSDAWLTNGNTNTNADNFLGTINEAPLLFRVNNFPSGQIEVTRYNTYFGYKSGMNPTPYNGENTCFGALTFVQNMFGASNAAFGTRALNHNFNGTANTAIGNDAMNANTTGTENVGVGFNALQNNTSGLGNTASGAWALHHATTSVDNTATGHFSLFTNTTGGDNTASGANAMFSNTTGSDNSAFGGHALFSNTIGTSNVASGVWALNSNTSGKQNTAAGAFALFSNKVGSNNASIGFQTMYHNIGNDNTAMGANAMFTTFEGERNSAFGSGALYTNGDGASNSATGYQALYWNNLGNENTATGYQAMYSNTNGNDNTAIGIGALYNNTLGDANSALGMQSLSHNVTGRFNVGIGSGADVASSNLTNATAIGSGAIVDASNKVRIGNSAVTVIEGQVPFTTPSDGRFKFDIQEDVKGLDFIMRLRPVTYHFDVQRFDALLSGKDNLASQAAYDEASHIRRTGFIAQEVEQAAQKSDYDFSGIVRPKAATDHYSLSYEAFVVPLVKAVQEQQKTIADLQQQVNELKKLVQH